MARSSASAQIAVLASVALCSFAANSLLCRIALREGLIDPASFTMVRLASGAVLLVMVGGKRAWWREGTWTSGLMLCLYAVAFSFAYLGMGAGVGALLLFSSVQATMIGVGLATSDHPTTMEWLGMSLGFGGLVYLLLPGATAPPLWAACLMILAGAAWGVYSLRGKGESDPAAATAGNFLRACPIAVALGLAFLARSRVSPTGVSLAVVSGAVTSGLGYVAWYAAVKHLTTVKAAILQLSVPVLTAVGAVLFLAETLSPRLVLSGILVLGGVALAVAGKARRPASNS